MRAKNLIGPAGAHTFGVPLVLVLLAFGVPLVLVLLAWNWVRGRAAETPLAKAFGCLLVISAGAG